MLIFPVENGVKKFVKPERIVGILPWRRAEAEFVLEDAGRLFRRVRRPNRFPDGHSL